jgi:hypothetical protein
MVHRIRRVKVLVSVRLNAVTHAKASNAIHAGTLSKSIWGPNFDP